MADSDENKGLITDDELGKLLLVAKRKPLPFAFGKDTKKPDESVLLLHRKYDTTKLQRLVKQAGFQPKLITIGQFTLDVKKAKFACENDPVPQMQKTLKGFFKAKGLTFMPVILNANGEEVTEGGPEEEYDQLLMKLQPLVDKCLQDQLGDVSKIRAVHGFAVGNADKGAYEKALKALAMLKKLVTEGLKGAGEGAATTPQTETASGQEGTGEGQENGEGGKVESAEEAKQRYESRLKKLAKPLQVALKKPTSLLTQIKELAVDVRNAAEAGDYADGNSALDLLENLVREALEELKAGGAPRGKVSPEMAFKQARLKWAMSKDTVQQELRNLMQLIMNAASDEDPEVQQYLSRELESKTKEIYDKLGNRARKLQELLDAKVEAQSETEQQEALQAVHEELDDYQKFVESDEDVQDLDNSPFGKVAVQATLASTINELRKTIPT